MTSERIYRDRRDIRASRTVASKGFQLTLIVLILQSFPFSIAQNANLCEGQELGTVFQDPDDCTKYFECDFDGEIEHMTCDTGKKFDASLETCVTDENPPCKSGTISTAPPTPPAAPSTLTELPTTTKPADSSSDKPSTEAPTTSTVTESSTELPTTSSPGTECSNEPYCKPTESGTFHRDRKDCSKYHLCMNGVATERSCNTGFHFDEEINACNYPSLVKCSPSTDDNCPTKPTESSSAAPSTEAPTTSTVTESSTAPPTTPAPSTSTELPTTSSPGTECSNEPYCKPTESGTFHRDRKDCSKFHLCMNGVSTAMSCNTGFHFDEEINACNYPSLVKCSPSSDDNCSTKPTESSTAAPSTEAQTTSIVTESSTAPPTTPAPSTSTELPTTSSPGRECSNEPYCKPTESGTFHRDRKDCSKFHLCMNGVSTAMSCNTGFHFDEDINACNYPSLVKCSPSTDDNCPTKPTESSSAAPSTEAPTTSTVTESSTAPPTTPAPSTSTEFPTTSSPGTECSNEPYCKPTESGTFHRDRKDCSKFHLCMNGVSTAMSCNTGFHFDEDINACNYPALVKCSPSTDDNCSPSSSAHSTTISTTPEDLTSTALTTLITTEATIPFVTTPPPSATECVTEPNCQVLQPGTFHRDKKDCRKYYVCCDGMAIAQFCPKSQYFNDVAKVCDLESRVECTTLDENCNVIPNCMTKPQFSYHRDSQDCGKFYSCRNGLAIPLFCSNGEYFDLNINACHFSFLVDCKPADIVPPPVIEPPSLRPFDAIMIPNGYVDPNINDCLNLPNGVVLNNPLHCSIYYICRNGVAIKDSCPDFKWFDDEMKACYNRNLVNCPSETD